MDANPLADRSALSDEELEEMKGYVVELGGGRAVLEVLRATMRQREGA